MPSIEWLIIGVIAIIALMAWGLGKDITNAHSTLIALHQTLMSLESDVAEIRDRVVGEKDENYGEPFPEDN